MIQIEMVPFKPPVNLIGWRAGNSFYDQLTNIVFAQANPNPPPWQGYYIGSTIDVALGYATNAIDVISGNGQAYVNAVYIDPNCFGEMQEIICTGPELTDTNSSGEEKAQALANALADQHGITVNPAHLVEGLASQGILYTGPADDGESGYETIIPYSIMREGVLFAQTYDRVFYRRYEEIGRSLTPYYAINPVQNMPPYNGNVCMLPPTGTAILSPL